MADTLQRLQVGTRSVTRRGRAGRGSGYSDHHTPEPRNVVEQYADYGVLFRPKAANTVFFFRNDSVYVFPPGGQPRVLDGPGGQ
jgi:hypothetical protein